MRACLQIFLMRGTRLAEMHLGVDHARQNMETRDVDRLAGAGAREIADFSDFSIRDTDVTHAHASMVDDRTALQDHVEASRHCWIPYKKLACVLPTARLSTKRRGGVEGLRGFG